MGNVECIELLLEHGANCNARDVAGTTPIINGAELNDMEPLALLLRLGKDPNVNHRTEQGNSALKTAVERNSVEIVKLLLGDPETDVNLVVKRAAFPNGAESSLRNTEGSSTALGEACSEIDADLGSSASVEIVKLLLAAPQVQCDFPQLLGAEARTPLQILCESNARVHSHRDWGTVGSPDYCSMKETKQRLQRC